MPGNEPNTPLALKFPLGYLITVTAYGNWLIGDERGSVDRDHNTFGEAPVSPDRAWVKSARGRLEGEVVRFSPPQRSVIDRTIRGVCAHRRWECYAVNVRTTHVHVVVGAERAPEPIMNSFKSWPTRWLTEAGLVKRGDRIWARHGSTRYLWTAHSMDRAIEYTNNEQDNLPFNKYRFDDGESDSAP